MKGLLKFVVWSWLFLLLTVMGQVQCGAVHGEQKHAETTCCYTQSQHPWEETLTFLLANRFGSLPQAIEASGTNDMLSKLKVIAQLKKEWEYLWKLQPHPVLAAPQDFHPYGRCAIDYYIYTLRRIVI